MVRRGVLSALVFLGAWLPDALNAQEPTRVGRITVLTAEVFGPEDASRGFLYRGANALHSVTRETTIRRFLLFEEGEAYDPAVLEETERNLRALGLFRSVSVVAGEEHDGVVDVAVTTQDAWTVLVGLSAVRGGGAMRGGLALGEKNLLGTASELRVAFAADQDRMYRSIEFLSPNFFLPFATAHLLYSNNSDGFERALALGRPFYSTRAPWAAGLAVSDVRRDEFRYAEGGATESAFRADRFRLVASYGIVLGVSDRNASRLSLGVDWREDRFQPDGEPSGGVPPADRRFRYVFLQ